MQEKAIVDEFVSKIKKKRTRGDKTQLRVNTRHINSFQNVIVPTR
jgi:hypothetical protein